MRRCGRIAGRGHDVKVWPEWTWLAGSVEACQRSDQRADRVGADPRRRPTPLPVTLGPVRLRGGF
jgi:hypothetical protein